MWETVTLQSYNKPSSSAQGWRELPGKCHYDERLQKEDISRHCTSMGDKSLENFYPPRDLKNTKQQPHNKVLSHWLFLSGWLCSIAQYKTNHFTGHYSKSPTKWAFTAKSASTPFPYCFHNHFFILLPERTKDILRASQHSWNSVSRNWKQTVKDLNDFQNKIIITAPESASQHTFPLRSYLIFSPSFISVSTLIRFGMVTFGRKLNFIFSLSSSLSRSLSLLLSFFCPLVLLVSKCVQREIKANAFLTLK